MFDVKTDVLALDFDGVIGNSIAECLVVGHNAYQNFIRKKNKIDKLEEFDKGRLPFAKRLRNYIRGGEDFVYIIMALDEGIHIRNQTEFDIFIEENKDKRGIFYENFYKERTKFSKDNPSQWANLNPLYKGMSEFIANYPNPENLYIISTKESKFIELVLANNYLEFIDGHILHATRPRPKNQIVNELLLKHNSAPSNLHFIDDQVDTLIKVKPTKVNCYLAKWGYNNETQIELAEKENIKVLTLSKFQTSFRY